MILSLQIPVLAVLLAAKAAADCQQIAGNIYCDAVKQVVYKNINGAGSYNRVTQMDSKTGNCQSVPQPFSGSLSPLHEELTVHFRGPLNLKQFGVYYPNNNSDKDKRDLDESPKLVQGRRSRHAHHHHKREPVIEYQTAYAYVTVDENEPVSTPAPPPPAPAAPSPSNPPAQPVDAPPEPVHNQPSPEVPHPEAANSTPSPASSAPGASFSSSRAPETSAPSNVSGAWKRSTFYDSSSGKAENCVFMNNMGGAGSGVFDYSFGASISYAGKDGTSCAASPEVLLDVTIPSNKEFMIFSDSKCSGDDCGYYRPGIPAYRGFSGGSKIFVFEFSMPSDHSNGFNADMPAIWLLNAQVPRTLQYGKQACSCWASGCGELDLFEVLNPGNMYLTNHLHSPQGAALGSTRGGGGTPNYFKRPVSGTLKAAAIFNEAEKSVSIVELDPSTNFDVALTSETVSKWLANTKDSATEVSI